MIQSTNRQYDALSLPVTSLAQESITTEMERPTLVSDCWQDNTHLTSTGMIFLETSPIQGETDKVQVIYIWDSSELHLIGGQKDS